MTRLSRELMELTAISDISYTPYQVSYERPDDSGNSKEFKIYLDSDNRTIKIISEASPEGDILVDRVDNLTLSFYDSSDDVWFAGPDIWNLSYIRIDLDLERASGSIISFSTTVNPRNTGG